MKIRDPVYSVWLCWIKKKKPIRDDYVFPLALVYAVTFRSGRHRASLGLFHSWTIFLSSHVPACALFSCFRCLRSCRQSTLKWAATQQFDCGLLKECIYSFIPSLYTLGTKHRERLIEWQINVWGLCKGTRTNYILSFSKPRTVLTLVLLGKSRFDSIHNIQFVITFFHNI